jgi:hypothetical protein
MLKKGFFKGIEMEAENKGANAEIFKSLKIQKNIFIDKCPLFLIGTKLNEYSQHFIFFVAYEWGI